MPIYRLYYTTWISRKSSLYIQYVIFFEGFSLWMINLLRGCFNISCPCILSIPQGPEIEANTNFMGVAKQKGGEIFPAQRRSFNFSKSHFDLAQMGGWIFCWGLFPDLLDMFGWTFSRCGAKIGWDHSSETYCTLFLATVNCGWCWGKVDGINGKTWFPGCFPPIFFFILPKTNYFSWTSMVGSEDEPHFWGDIRSFSGIG